MRDVIKPAGLVRQVAPVGLMLMGWAVTATAQLSPGVTVRFEPTATGSTMVAAPLYAEFLSGTVTRPEGIYTGFGSADGRDGRFASLADIHYRATFANDVVSATIVTLTMSGEFRVPVFVSDGRPLFASFTAWGHASFLSGVNDVDRMSVSLTGTSIAQGGGVNAPVLRPSVSFMGNASGVTASGSNGGIYGTYAIGSIDPGDL